jgi:hypothetical protein
MTIPVLPPHIITTILSHLLPPIPPLPHELIAKTLFDRLRYLPPSDDDVESWLTPYPPAEAPTKGSELVERLTGLANGHELGQAVYATDGEMVFARIPIVPPSTYARPAEAAANPLRSSDGGLEDDGESVDVILVYEGGENERGWVYHASALPSAQIGQLDWKPDLSSVRLTPATQSESISLNTPDETTLNPPAGCYAAEPGHGANGTAPADYWAGFSPPKETIDLSEEYQPDTADQEAAYWAQYSAAATPGANGQSQVQTPAGISPSLGSRPLPQSRQASVHRPKQGGEEYGGTYERLLVDSKGMTKREKSIGDLPGLLSALPSSISPRKFEHFDDPTADSDDDQAPNGHHSQDDPSNVRDKVEARVKSTLHDLWRSHTSEGDLDSQALKWFSIGREVIDSSKAHTSYASGANANGANGSVDPSDLVIRAKMEVLRDMWEVVQDQSERRDGSSPNDSFWRCIEGTIRQAPAGEMNGHGFDQETYWE